MNGKNITKINCIENEKNKVLYKRTLQNTVTDLPKVTFETNDKNKVINVPKISVAFNYNIFV